MLALGQFRAVLVSINLGSILYAIWPKKWMQRGGKLLKKWMQKIIEQLDPSIKITSENEHPAGEISDERGTLLFLLDVFSKNAIDTDTTGARKVREEMDAIAKELVAANDINLEKTLFRLRQFMSELRVEEYTYVQKSFSDFRKIIWEFVENLTQETVIEQKDETVLDESLNLLREAVDSNSTDQLKAQSKQFIQEYVNYQTTRTQRRGKRVETIKKNLNTVKKQLNDANNSLRVDHLTGAFNRRTFDETIQQQWNMFQLSAVPVTMLMLDLDHFKKINDSYGHPMGDAVLRETVKLLREVFGRESDFSARVS